MNNRLSHAFSRDAALHERALDAAWLWRIKPLESAFIDPQAFPLLAFAKGAFTSREWLVPLFSQDSVDVDTVKLLLDVLRIRGDARFTLKTCCHTLLRLIISELQRCALHGRPFLISRFYRLFYNKCQTHYGI